MMWMVWADAFPAFLRASSGAFAVSVFVSTVFALFCASSSMFFKQEIVFSRTREAARCSSTSVPAPVSRVQRSLESQKSNLIPDPHGPFQRRTLQRTRCAMIFVPSCGVTSPEERRSARLGSNARRPNRHRELGALFSPRAWIGGYRDWDV